MELIKSHVASFYRPAGHFQPGETICLTWRGECLASRAVAFKGYCQEIQCHVLVDRDTDQEEGDYIYSFKVIDYGTHRLETLDADP